MELLEVNRRPYRRHEYYEVRDYVPEEGDYCIVERDGEDDCGVLVGPPIVSDDEVEHKIEGTLLREATEKEIETLNQNLKSEKEAYKIGREKIREQELPMKLITVEYSLDRNKITFFFSAEGRIDFRELVKELSHVFRTRIEMRQIGVRDEARLLGGFGLCGQSFCCSQFLTKFSPITIKMAKEQNLALNPSKISGCCGRLMCCLSYELDFYKKHKHCFPRPGTFIKYDGQERVVSGYNIIKDTVTLKHEDSIIEVSLKELEAAREPQTKRDHPRSKPDQKR